METTGEVEGLLNKIQPPRLEDAGLEDCALPPDSIKEAFLKAATAVGSRAASIFSQSAGEEEEEEERSCVNDPWPTLGDLSSDTLVGIREGVDPPPGACDAEKGGGVPEVMGDEVAAGVTDADEKAADMVVVGGPKEEGGGEACVDGFRGLKIGDKGEKEKGKKLKSNDEDEEEREGERPILAEAYV